MSLIGIDKNEVLEFSSASDNTEPKTVFVIKTIDNKSKMSIFSKVITPDGQVDVHGLQSQSYDILKMGLKEVKNLMVKGEVKNFAQITDDVINTLPMMTLIEVASKVIEFNFLSDNERKN